jgi:sugar/nucleoside kinase (ribokinase family)
MTSLASSSVVLRKPIDTAVVSRGSDGSIYFIDEGGSRVQRHWIMLPSFPEL